MPVLGPNPKNRHQQHMNVRHVKVLILAATNKCTLQDLRGPSTPLSESLGLSVN